MLEPNGPLPPEIYWRRRVLAAALAALAVLVVVLLIVFVGGGKDSSEPAAADSSSATQTDLPSSQPPSSGESGAPGGGSAAGQSGAPQSGASPSGAPQSGAQSSGAPQSGGGVPTPGAVVAGGPCPDTNISVVVAADKPSYAVGEQPTFEATVTNAGSVPCSRDIGTGQQQLAVLTLDGSKQLWSNFDCTFQPEIKNEVLQPGQQIRYKLQWAGTTSAPGCQAQRVPVAPGAYQVVAQFGAKRSAPVTFNVTKPAPPAPVPAPGG
ncbi:BsuPI-related putative proteinase inhibitor [Tsukamurella paurometabola]|uniref:Uncharacterized protein n=1 Tax=Tsukamurella paurometabola (strain ATCC 8368 / DSM 20162 / CCUG 35730 / CIP 100753 / JCM 10117 / KCTC 9821 / NBRC 16120 / NCIMB 702349 / NCTC 13040) TaxID=521096 RepID=D5USU8_TSUPD|nr:BsuPI-related putative proteinase inhibitor [Tsukamurella paurometabola]ADG77235.1 conserved hypothetical protein [Tsukamurella paurometabola DSM 20162]SUP43241.1 Uncharacterised protein [Tsukamurella paurometabola]